MRLSGEEQQAVTVVTDLLEVLEVEDARPVVRDLPLPTAAQGGAAEDMRAFVRRMRGQKRRDSRAEVVSARRDGDRQQVVDMSGFSGLDWWADRKLPEVPAADAGGSAFLLEEIDLDLEVEAAAGNLDKAI